jgi:flagellar basal-body rod protein FlgG
MLQQDGPPGSTASGSQIGELGMASVAEEPMIDFTQGALQETGRGLDMALEGPGFFVVRTPDGERYTRDGAFTRTATGRLITSEGDEVLDAGGNPIDLPPGRLAVSSEGNITVEDAPVAQLGIVEFTLDQPLKKVGKNQFVPRNEGDQGRPNTSTAVHQEAVEVSNLDMAGAQTTMMELQRAYQASQRLIQYQDEMVGRAVNDIARPIS